MDYWGGGGGGEGAKGMLVAPSKIIGWASPPPPLFHIEIEGKCGWLIGGWEGAKGMLVAPLSNYWVGLPPPLFFEDNSSTHYYLAIIPKLIK